MQTVAAQWLMTSLTTSAFLVGAIQATNLPGAVARNPGRRPPGDRARRGEPESGRAIGPAIGGLLRAATSAALVFVNAASFLAVIAVVATVAIPARAFTLPREQVGSAQFIARWGHGR